MTASTMMIEMTIINSSSVKPEALEGGKRKAEGRRRRRRDGRASFNARCSLPSAFCLLPSAFRISPVLILRPVERRAFGFGGHIEDAGVGLLGASVGRIERRVKAPRLLARDRIDRNLAQVNLLLVRE